MSHRAKNTVFNVLGVTAGQLGDGAFHFIISILLARLFPVEDYGFYNFVFAWVAYIILLSDFGLHQILVREIAHKKEQASALFSNAAFIRFIFSISISALIGVGTWLFSGYEGWKIILVNLALSTLLLNAISPGSLFDSFNLSRYDALFRLLATTMYSAASAYILLCTGVRSLPLIVLISVSSQLIYTIQGHWFFKRKISSIKPSINLDVIKGLLKEGKTIVWARLMAQVYTNMDLIMIGLILNDREVGYYAIAYKILFAAIALNSALYRVFLPLISEARDDIERLKARLASLVKLLAFTSLPITVFGMAFADDIIVLFYTGKYTPSIAVLRILFLYVGIVGIGAIYGTTLFSLGKNKQYTAGIMLGAISNILLNLVLIPTLGIIGAGIATIVSQIIVTAYTYFAFRKFISLPVVKHIGFFGGLSLLTAIGAFLLTDLVNLHFLISIAICGWIYIFICMISGVFSQEELARAGIDWGKKC